MDIKEFNTKLFSLVDGLEQTEAVELSQQLYRKGYFSRDFNFKEIGTDITKLKTAIKIGIQKVSIEDLDAIAPPTIKQAIVEFIDINEVPDDTFYSQPLVEQQESKDALVMEAQQISAQRRSDREEIPKDLQRRMGYIIAKLNIVYKLQRSEIARLINIHRNTVNEYAKSTMESQPDLIRMWSGSTENKTQLKIEETVAKRVGEKAIETVKANINLGDGLRNNYAIEAAQRGYNLYNAGDLERLVNSAIQLFFQHEAVYMNIITLEKENDRLRQKIQNLESRVAEINDIEMLLLN